MKILGFIILTLSGLMIGISSANKLSNKVKFIEQYMDFIKSIQSDIKYTASSTKQIIKKYLNDNLLFSTYLSNCFDFINQGFDFPKAWELAFSEAEKKCLISKNFSEIVINFGKKLGSNDVQGAISHCKYNYEIAKPYLEKAMEEQRTKGKLYIILGICSGMILSLFLI